MFNNSADRWQSPMIADTRPCRVGERRRSIKRCSWLTSRHSKSTIRDWPYGHTCGCDIQISGCDDRYFTNF